MQRILILGPSHDVMMILKVLIRIGTSPMAHAFLAAPGKTYPERIDMVQFMPKREIKINTYPQIHRRGHRNNHQAMRAQVVRHKKKPPRKQFMRNR